MLHSKKLQVIRRYVLQKIDIFIRVKSGHLICSTPCRFLQKKKIKKKKKEKKERWDSIHFFIFFKKKVNLYHNIEFLVKSIIDNHIMNHMHTLWLHIMTWNKMLFIVLNVYLTFDSSYLVHNWNFQHRLFFLKKKGELLY